MATKISAHFALEELLVSDYATSHGIKNTPTPEHLKNMEKYLAPGLEEVRDICGSNRSVNVNSAYRNPEINHAVGGTPTSAHPQGFAADIVVAGLSALETAKLIAASMKGRHIKIDQLILESGRSVVHVSFDPRGRMMMGHQPGVAGTPINWKYFN